MARGVVLGNSWVVRRRRRTQASRLGQATGGELVFARQCLPTFVETRIERLIQLGCITWKGFEVLADQMSELQGFAPDTTCLEGLDFNPTVLTLITR